jgi:ATP-dependent DNA helicase RecG
VLPGGAANLEFVRLIAEENQEGKPLRLDELLLLNGLWMERRQSTAEASELIQKSEPEARAVLGSLVERGFVEPRGEGKGRTYHLSAAIYRRLGAQSAYVHQRGFEPLQQEQMILQFLGSHGKIARRDIAALCKISPAQARTVISKLLKAGKIVQRGSKRGAFYELKS